MVEVIHRSHSKVKNVTTFAMSVKMMVRKLALSFDQEAVAKNSAALGGFERWKVGWRGSKLDLSGKKNACWFTWCSLRAGKEIVQKNTRSWCICFPFSPYTFKLWSRASEEFRDVRT